MTATASPALEREELKGRPPVSRTTIHGWPSIIFGLPFAVVGTFILMIGFGKIKVPASSVHAPLWVLGAVGAMFFLAGLFLIVHGLLGLGRKARVKEGQRMHRNRPWMWDYPWEPLGITENKLKQVMNSLGATVFFIGFMAPFNWLAFYSEEVVPMWVKGVVGVFDLVILMVCYDFVRKSIQYFKYGNSRLGFNAFPFHLGDTLSVKLIDLPRGINALYLDLRFIEEQYETRGTGDNRRQEVVCYQRYHESRTLKGNEVSPAELFLLEWDLPDEPEWTTTLSARPARFWELEVKADTPGVDYHSRFLLPVYAGG